MSFVVGQVDCINTFKFDSLAICINNLPEGFRLYFQGDVDQCYSPPCVLVTGTKKIEYFIIIK